MEYVEHITNILCYYLIILIDYILWIVNDVKLKWRNDNMKLSMIDKNTEEL